MAAPRVAVLCASRTSVYHSMAGIDVYDEARNAYTLGGGVSVVAHPPCRAWSAFCGHQSKPLPGERELAPFCVEQIKACGGVLEHPAYSRLWDELDLPKPGERQRDGLWSLAVRQSWWGDLRSKHTWLLIGGIEGFELPEIPYVLHDGRSDREEWNRMSKRQRAATPRAFAEWLVSAARAAAAKRQCPIGHW